MCDNIKVAIKVRPLIRREKETGLSSLWRIKDNTIASIDPNSFSEPYCFDHIFDEAKSTQSLFEVVAKPIIQNCMKGINGTIFAYGQTSSGKTHTMTGTDTELGVIPLSIHQIFREIESMAPERQFLLRIAYIEIYNEKIFDLLDGKLSELKIRDTQNTGEANVKCYEIIVNSPETILHYLAEGNTAKRMEETKMNERSSRSHTIFRITIESRAIPNGTEENDESVVQISNLNLVDLAGSEKADQTGTTGARLKEGAYINRSLFSLGFVIKQLSEKGPETFINYRDSKLTRILQASLGGNSMTSIICTITPATADETNYTLLFAMRAKTIKNKPIINESVSEATAMRRLNKEISRLKEQLQVEKQKNSKFHIEQLERDINERETKFVGSYTMRTTDKSRRRTWCPSSTHVNELSVVYEEKESNGGGLLRPSSDHGVLTNINLDRESPTPFSDMRDFDLIDDMFLLRPAEDNLSFGTRSEQSLSPNNIMTPLAFKKTFRNQSNNKCEDNCQCEQLEKELNDLKEFTRLEKKFDSKSCTSLLPQDYHEVKDKLFQKNLQLEILSSRNSELEFRLETKLNSITKMEKDLEKVTTDLNDAIKSRSAADQAKICAEYEFDQLKKRTASREKELTDMIDEFRRNENNAKFMDRIQALEDQIKEMENQNLVLQSEISDGKLKYETLEKINSQLIIDLEQEKLKLQTYLTDTKSSIELLEESNKNYENDLENEKIKLELVTKENLVLFNELENNKNALVLSKDVPCEKCLEITEKLNTEQLRYGKLKQDFDSLVSSDLQEIQSAVLTLQHYLKSLMSEDLSGSGSGKENKNINDYIKDLKTICSSTSYVLAEKYNSNVNLNQSIEEFSAADLGIKNSSFILSSRDEVVIETLQNRTIDLENQILKISNQLNKEFDTKAMQTEWQYEEFVLLNSKYVDLQTSYKKLQTEYDDISTGIMDWIQENEVIKKQITELETEHDELKEKFKALLVEKQTLEEHKELSSLRANYEEAVKFNQSLQENLNDYSTLKSKYDNLCDEKLQLEEQLIEKRAENELLHSIEAKYDELLSDKVNLEQKFAEAVKIDIIPNNIETQVANVSDENPNEKSRKDSLNELSLLQTKYSDLMRENESVLNKYNALVETNKELYESLNSITKEHELVSNSLSLIEEKCTAIEKHRDFIKIKYNAIIHEYRQLFSSFSNNEIKLENLEKETKALKDELIEFELIQDKYEKIHAEKTLVDSSCGGDELETSELNAKKLVDEIALLSDKFEAVVSERNLVEADYELLRSEYNATKEILETKTELLDSIRQKYEHVLEERESLQKTIDELRDISVENLKEYEKLKNEFEEQISLNQAEYKQLEAETQVLNVKYNTLADEYSESEKLLKESRETEKSLEQNIASLSRNMTVLQDKYEELEQLSETLKSSLEKASEFEKKYSSILIEKQIQDKQVKDLSMELHNCECKFQDIQSGYERLQQEIKLAEENHNKLLTKVTEIQESKATMETQLRSELVVMEQRCETDLQTINQKLEEYQWNLQEVETTKSLELESVRQLFEIKYNELERSKSNLANEYKKLESEQNEYKQLVENLKSEVKTLKTERINLQKMLAEAEQTKSDLEKNLKCQLNSIEKEFENLQSTVEDLRDGKSSTEQELGSQINSLKLKYGAMEKDLKAELNDIQQKYGVLQNTAEELGALQNKYKKLQTAFEELGITKAMMEKNLNSVQQNSDRMQITIKTLEQNKLTVEQRCAQLQSEHNDLKKQHLLLLTNSSELEKSVANFEAENKMLRQSKQDIEVILKKQAAQIYEINTRLTESETKQIKFKVDYETFEQRSKSLQAELDTLKTQSKSLADHSAELKEKSKRIEILESKKKELLAQLHELQNMHLFKTSQFEHELIALSTKLEEANMKQMQLQKHSNVSKNKLLNENSDLKKKNQTLYIELDDIKRKQNDRKSRRSITYDNNRSTLLDVQTIGTMTDKSESSCNCDIMNEKIKELTRESYIKDCHITNYKIKEKNNPLIMECSELREKLSLSENNILDLEKQLTQLNIKLRKAREKSTSNTSSQTPTRPASKTIGTNTDIIKSSPNKPKHNPSSISKPSPAQVQTMDRLIQTEFVVNHESKDELHTTIRKLESEVNRLRMRYEESKCLAIARRRKIDILNDQLAKFQRA